MCVCMYKCICIYIHIHLYTHILEGYVKESKYL